MIRGFARGCLLALAACAGAQPEREGSFVAAGFSAVQLARERVAVLPVDAVGLPSAVPAELDPDSLAASLADYAAAALAQRVDRGVVGRGVGPQALAPALAAVGGAVLARAYHAVLRPHADPGALGEAAAADFEILSRSVGARFFLVPLTLDYEAVEPHRFRAVLDLALVDASVGRTVWRDRVSAPNPDAPSGAAMDLFAAALEDATAAVAERAARRLSTVGEAEADEPIEDFE